MSDRYSKISKIVFGTLLSLSIYGLATHAIEWGSEKCSSVSSWDGKKIKIIIMVIIFLISIYFVLKGHSRKISSTSRKVRKVQGTVVSA